MPVPGGLVPGGRSGQGARGGQAAEIGQVAAQRDRPLEVHSRLGVAEYPLGGPPRRHPGGQFPVRPARREPVAGRLGRQHVIARRLQHRRRPLVQHRPLTGQQRARHRLGQQCVPRPARPGHPAIGRPARTAGRIAGVGEQPGRRQLVQPLPHRLRALPGDLAQRRLVQRPARHRERREHCPPARTAPPGPRQQQFRQPGRQPRRNRGHAARTVVRVSLVTVRAVRLGLGQRRGDQLLGEERIALRPGEHLIGQPVRHRAARQPGDLVADLGPAQRPQPDLRHRAAAADMRQPRHHQLVQRRLIAAAGDHHRQPGPAARPQQIRQAVQGRGIRPVHILDDHADRGPAGHHGEDVRHRREQPVPLPAAGRTAGSRRTAPVTRA